jgi:hypothetical protein
MHSRDLTQTVATAWQHELPFSSGSAVPAPRSANSARAPRFLGSEAGHALERCAYPYLFSYLSRRVDELRKRLNPPESGEFRWLWAILGLNLWFAVF